MVLAIVFFIFTCLNLESSLCWDYNQKLHSQFLLAHSSNKTLLMVLQNEVTWVHPILGSGIAIICGLSTIYCYGQAGLGKRFGRDLAGLVLKVNAQIPNNIYYKLKFKRFFFTFFLISSWLNIDKCGKLHITFTFILTIERNCINFLSCAAR